MQVKSYDPFIRVAFIWLIEQLEKYSKLNKFPLVVSVGVIMLLFVTKQASDKPVIPSCSDPILQKIKKIRNKLSPKNKLYSKRNKMNKTCVLVHESPAKRIVVVVANNKRKRYAR